MFSRSNPAAAAAPRAKNGPGLSFIGPEAVISGDFATGSHLHVDGRIDGHVRCSQLIQGEGGTIAGDIVAEEARIAGLVQGTVSARTVIVEASGRITGDVTNETITIVVPHFVPSIRIYDALHMQMAELLRRELLSTPGVVITEVPYQIP